MIAPIPLNDGSLEQSVAPQCAYDPHWDANAIYEELQQIDLDIIALQTSSQEGVNGAHNPSVTNTLSVSNTTLAGALTAMLVAAGAFHIGFYAVDFNSEAGGSYDILFSIIKP